MQPPIRQGDIPGVQLRYAKVFDLTAGELWRWITEPPLMSRWLADVVEPRGDGGGWVLRGIDESGAELLEEARTVASDPGRVWVAIFERQGDDWESATRLTFRVDGVAPCELSVLQQGFERLNLSRCLTIWELYRRRWRSAFERLESACSDNRAAGH